MSDKPTAGVTELEMRLKRDGITVSDEERDRLIELTPIAQDWVKQISIPETRYAEPAITHYPR
jgi:hypothetical protein